MASVIEYRQSEDVICRTIAGETLLVPIRGTVAEMDRLYALEGCAKDVWELLREPRSRDMLVEAILSRYESDTAVVSRAMAELLEEMKARSLIVEVGVENIRG